MTFDHPNLSAHPRDAIRAHLDTAAALECDWCGSTVSPETAVRRLHRGTDEADAVILCPACDRGVD